MRTVDFALVFVVAARYIARSKVVGEMERARGNNS